MKYNDDNKPIVCMLKNNYVYKQTVSMKPVGVLWHDTGADNTTIKRYVQPTEDDPNREKLLETIGVNKNANDWNHTSRKACVNAFIGKLANGELTTVQTMPWNYKPGGCGKGNKGSCNNGWVQFEIAQDSKKNKDYFEACYKEGCELTAYICKMYGIDPHGTVKYNGVTVPTILCHSDSYKLGLGSGHSDVYDWFNIYGKTMDNVRDDVAELLEGDDEEMSYEKWKEYMEQYRKEFQDNDSTEWSKQARDWAIKNGLVAGGGKTKEGEPNYMWEDFMNREQFFTVMYRFAQDRGLE